MYRLTAARFSPCRTYRYTLERVWRPSAPLVMFVGLNPSTADEAKDDPTVRRCMGFARRWGFGGAIVTNLFAYRTTDPRELHHVSEPVGSENDEWINRCQDEAELIVVAWGNGGRYLARASVVLPMLRHPHALALNKTGQPAHPLFLQENLRPVKLSEMAQK